MALTRSVKWRVPVGSGKMARAVGLVLLAGITMGWVTESDSVAQPPARGEVPLVYNKGRNFRIPFNLNAEERTRIREVLLFVSEDSGYSWKSVSRTFPDHPTFTYRATHDGEFWFTVQTRTVDGKVSPRLDSAVEPKMKVVVDTVRPLFTLEPDERRGSMASVRWEIKDENLDPKSLVIEYQIAGAPTWRKVPIRKLKLIGSQSWDAGTADTLRVRGSVADLAGNITEAKIDLGEGTPNPPEMGPDDDEAGDAARVARIPYREDSDIVAGPDFTPVRSGPVKDARRGVSEDPGSNRLINSEERISPERTLAPRSKAQPRAPLEDLAQEPARRAPVAWDRDANSQVPRAPGTGPRDTRDLFAAAKGTTAEVVAAAGKAVGQPAAGRPKAAEGSAARGSSLLVGSPRFKLAYAIEDAGPSGPAVVELWITQDGGRTWIRRGEDPDRVTPVDVDLGGEGTFGVSLVARSASGLGDQPPAPGDPPQTWVEVDSTQPSVQLEPVQIGTGTNSGKVAISWRASDLHLAPKAVTLLWRDDKPGSAWQPFAESQENAGQFIWTVPASVPPRFHVRVEAVDTIGHRGGAETTDLGPILMDRSRPRSRIIGLDPNARAGTGTDSWPVR